MITSRFLLAVCAVTFMATICVTVASSTANSTPSRTFKIRVLPGHGASCFDVDREQENPCHMSTLSESVDPSEPIERCSMSSCVPDSFAVGYDLESGLEFSEDDSGADELLANLHETTLLVRLGIRRSANVQDASASDMDPSEYRWMTYTKSLVLSYEHPITFNFEPGKFLVVAHIVWAKDVETLIASTNDAIIAASLATSPPLLYSHLDFPEAQPHFTAAPYVEFADYMQATHLPFSRLGFLATTGPVIDMGFGRSSTPQLHNWVLKQMNATSRYRYIVSLENDQEFFDDFLSNQWPDLCRSMQEWQRDVSAVATSELPSSVPVLSQQGAPVKWHYAQVTDWSHEAYAQLARETQWGVALLDQWPIHERYRWLAYFAEHGNAQIVVLHDANIGLSPYTYPMNWSSFGFACWRMAHSRLFGHRAAVLIASTNSSLCHVVHAPTLNYDGTEESLLVHIHGDVAPVALPPPLSVDALRLVDQLCALTMPHPLSGISGPQPPLPPQYSYLPVMTSVLLSTTGPILDIGGDTVSILQGITSRSQSTETDSDHGHGAGNYSRLLAKRLALGGVTIVHDGKQGAATSRHDVMSRLTDVWGTSNLGDANDMDATRHSVQRYDSDSLTQIVGQKHWGVIVIDNNGWAIRGKLLDVVRAHADIIIVHDASALIHGHIIAPWKFLDAREYLMSDDRHSGIPSTLVVSDQPGISTAFQSPSCVFAT